MSFEILPNHIYDEYELRAAGVFSEADLKKARASGLRFKEVRKGRRLYRGLWLLAWLSGVKPKSKRKELDQ